MLIKYYAKYGDVMIIDGVKDVSVKARGTDHAQFMVDPWVWMDFDGDETQTDTSENADQPRIITYSHDGPCALAVSGTAYICNDDGKTIEKVCVSECVVSG